ncbi:hypothetical protein DFP73DRAFT_593311 [Morchella snyderi]|nr:hypothetical protein DFP73DRAFT_593311 [Morchella snyderi]
MSRFSSVPASSASAHAAAGPPPLRRSTRVSVAPVRYTPSFVPRKAVPRRSRALRLPVPASIAPRASPAATAKPRKIARRRRTRKAPAPARDPTPPQFSASSSPLSSPERSLSTISDVPSSPVGALMSLVAAAISSPVNPVGTPSFFSAAASTTSAAAGTSSPTSAASAAAKLKYKISSSNIASPEVATPPISAASSVASSMASCSPSSVSKEPSSPFDLPASPTFFSSLSASSPAPSNTSSSPLSSPGADPASVSSPALSNASSSLLSLPGADTASISSPSPTNVPGSYLSSSATGPASGSLAAALVTETNEKYINHEKARAARILAEGRKRKDGGPLGFYRSRLVYNLIAQLSACTARFKLDETVDANGNSIAKIFPEDSGVSQIVVYIQEGDTTVDVFLGRPKEVTVTFGKVGGVLQMVGVVTAGPEYVETEDLMELGD